jgi:hypothetical protein
MKNINNSRGAIVVEVEPGKIQLALPGSARVACLASCEVGRGLKIFASMARRSPGATKAVRRIEPQPGASL